MQRQAHALRGHCRILTLVSPWSSHLTPLYMHHLTLSYPAGAGAVWEPQCYLYPYHMLHLSAHHMLLRCCIYRAAILTPSYLVSPRTRYAVPL